MSGRLPSTPRIDVLGPLRVTVDDVPVEVSREQVRCVVTVLGAHAGSFVSHDALIDLLWSDRLPAQPKSALLVVTSRVRSAFGSASWAIESGADGIRAVADSDVIDFQRNDFLSNGLASDLDATTALKMCEDKLGLWRGEPFGDFARSDLLRPLAAQLAQAWWGYSMRSAELLLEVGQHARCVEVASALHAREPQRERLAVVLARALAELGRRSEALAVLASTRRHLRDQFGLDVDDSVIAVEQDILGNAIDLLTVAHGTQQVAPKEFVGRHRELDWLGTHRLGLRALVAEPGAGKSALLAQLEERCLRDGRAIWLVRTPPRPDRPMAVAADLVAHALVIAEPPDHDELVHAAITRLTGRTLPATRRLQAVTRDGLIEAAARYVSLIAGRCDAVIMIDDAHWIDAGSLDVLERLARDCDVVLAGRPVAVGAPGSWVARIDPEDVRVLAPLNRDEIAELASTRFRPVDVARTADVVHRQSAGNALFVNLLLDHLAEGGEARRTDLPVSVLIAVQQRLDTLSASSRQALICLAVFGDAAPTWAMAELRPTYERDLDEAIEAHLVVADGGDNLEFVHGLVADAVYVSAGDGRRIELHDAIGQILELGGRPAGEAARHFHEAASLDPERAAAAHLAAAIEAEEAFDWELVAQHTKLGLAQTSDATMSAKLAIHLARGQAVLHTGGSAAPLIRAAEAARTVGDDQLFVEAVTALASQIWSLSDHDPAAIQDLYDEALQLAVPAPIRGRLCAAVASLVVETGYPDARVVYHEAVDIALGLDDPTDQADIVRYARWGLGHPDDFALFFEVATLLGDLAGASPDLRWASVSNRFAAGVIAGDRALIDGAVADFRAGSMVNPGNQAAWETAHVEAGYALFSGDPDGAEAWLGRILQLLTKEKADTANQAANETENGTAVASVPIESAGKFANIYGVLLLGIRRAQGRIVEMGPLIDEALVVEPDRVSWRCAAAEVAAAAGDLDRVRKELDRIEELDVDAIPHNFMWTASMKMYAEGIAAVGDVKLAERARMMLAPYSRRMSWTGFCSVGPIDMVLADLADVCGDHEAADIHRVRSATLLQQLNRGIDSPPLLRPDPDGIGAT